MTAEEIRALVKAFAEDPTIDPIVKATGISSIYQECMMQRGPAQDAAVAKVKELGYIGLRRTGNIPFLYNEVRYIFQSAYRTYSFDHIKEYAQAMRIADTIKKQAVINCKAVEEGMTLGPNDIPPAKFKVTRATIRRDTQRNGTPYFRKSTRVAPFKDPIPHGG